MWYDKSFRRHLMDMHIEDWNKEFLSEFSPEEYVENLKKGKFKSAMIYFQSHVGLCYYPTKTGVIHKAFEGKENTIQKVMELCRKSDIDVVGYYSVIFNNREYERHPEWRIVDENGNSNYGKRLETGNQFAQNDIYRYGLCCPNNEQYRKFVGQQIKEMSEYFNVDGMFYDMVYWPQMCYCPSCRKRWSDEVGGEIPVKPDWNSSEWLLHMRKRQEWITDFARFLKEETKKNLPTASFEVNYAYAAIFAPLSNNTEEVAELCDYVGGDVYMDEYSQSFICKFYRNITQKQPFEHMFSRCAPALSTHTLTRSDDETFSNLALTLAHHGANLYIDAIDPIGTTDRRVYEQIGRINDKLIPYEKYICGTAAEDIGIYYSLKSRFRLSDSPYTNYDAIHNLTRNFIKHNIPFGITGSFGQLDRHKIIIASCLTDEDDESVEALVEYVKNGGCLYFSDVRNKKLVERLLEGKICGKTEEKIIYYAPDKRAGKTFGRYCEKYPLFLEGSAGIVNDATDCRSIAKITLPYTAQNDVRFASIHSNPPGRKTDIDGVLFKKYGKGKVLWSAVPIECGKMYDYAEILINMLENFFEYSEPSFKSDASADVEITEFKDSDSIYINANLLCRDYKARKVGNIEVKVKCDRFPKKILLLPDEKEIEYDFSEGYVKFDVKKLDIFAMYKIEL